MRRSSGGVGAPRAMAMALALVLAAMAMGACLTHGVTTTPSSASGSAVDALLQPGKTTPSATAGRAAQVDGGEDEPPTPLKEGAATGSRLPDCAHACGPCAPCRRVMVSFRCVDAASEPCPIAYRCMCRGRFFRVPTL